MGQILNRVTRFKWGGKLKHKRIPECHVNDTFINICEQEGPMMVYDAAEYPSAPGGKVAWDFRVPQGHKSTHSLLYHRKKFQP